MGGQFHIKNPGKPGISLNVRDPRGLAIAKRLIGRCPTSWPRASRPACWRSGVLGYDAPRSVRLDIIYVKRSRAWGHRAYGRLRTVGPIAAAFAGNPSSPAA